MTWGIKWSHWTYDQWRYMTRKVLWGSTIGYPSDSLASFNSPTPRAVIEFTKRWCKWDCSGARCCFKMLCLSPPSRCASATKGYVTTKLEMSMTLRMMMMTVSDSGSTYYNCFCDMLSSLKSYHIFVVKQHVGSSVVSFKEKVAIFLSNLTVRIQGRPN